MTIPRNLSFLAQGASSTGVLGTANGGTNLTSFTVNGIPYASSSSVLNTSSDLTWTGSALVVNGNQTLGNGTGAKFLNFNAGSSGSYILGQISSANTYFVGDTISALGTGTGYITYVYGANPTIWYNNGSETARIHASGGVSIGNRTDPGATNLSVTGTGKYGTTVSVGAATPSASGAGITFPATQSPSSDPNTLDDYEEGSWTPTDASGASLSISITYASYTKIGNTVFARAYVDYPVTASTANAILTLPFTSVSTVIGNALSTTAAGTACCVSSAGLAQLTFRNTTFTNITNAALSGATILFSISYVV